MKNKAQIPELKRKSRTQVENPQIANAILPKKIQIGLSRGPTIMTFLRKCKHRSLSRISMERIMKKVII